MCQCVDQNKSKYSCIRHENQTFSPRGVPEATHLSEEVMRVKLKLLFA